MWDYTAILRTSGEAVPIPKDAKVVTAIMEDYAVRKIQKWASRKKIATILPSSGREYPDITLETRDGLTIALDIKTARVKNENTISRVTLGSYGGYFRNPAQKKPGCRLPYGAFNQHWITAFIYEWRPAERSEHMVKIKDIVVCEKWKIASKSTGTGTTKHIGSITNVGKLKRHNGEFSSNEEFEKYWRNY